MNVFWALLKIGWPYLLGLVLIGSAYEFAHHRGAVAQKAKDDKVIAALKAELAADDASLHEWAHAGDQWKAAQAAQEAAQAAQAKQAAAALAAFQQASQSRVKALQNALAAQRAAYKGDACAALPLPEGVQ